MGEESVLKACVEVRTLVYRIILTSLEEQAKANPILLGGTILSYLFICSPKVSFAIFEYLASETDLMDKADEAKRKLIKENSFLAAWAKSMVYDLERMSKHKAVRSEKIEAIANAMCAELGVSVDVLRGTAKEEVPSAPDVNGA